MRDKMTVENNKNLNDVIKSIGVSANKAARVLATSSIKVRQSAIIAISDEIASNVDKILIANEKDMKNAESEGLSNAMLDRLKLDKDRILSISQGLVAIANQQDPIGKTLGINKRPNGLIIEKISVPVGVITIIYESRPNVTADAGALCLMSGNAVILRGGSESFNSSHAILSCMHTGLRSAKLPESSIQLVPTKDRTAVGILLGMENKIDLVIPRGGRSLIERIFAESRIPVLAHLDGICHTYIHSEADPKMAKDLLFNAKMRRTGICGATETLLIDSKIINNLSMIIDPLVNAGCELRGDKAACEIDKRLLAATDKDWKTEYLDSILSIKVVKNLSEAIDHINKYGSHHTDSIVTEDDVVASKFMNEVDSGIVMHNTSTQFADGGEFGMGAEIGISTGKLHARGPVGIEQLTTYKYKVRGCGQVRP
tara:strand:+ start:3447 stop:4730 length:1284 start_codon:yes stop_codon:yes gene_type:complete